LSFRYPPGFDLLVSLLCSESTILEETSQEAPTPVSSTDGIIVPAVDTYRTLTGISFVNLPRNWFVDASFLYAESDGENKGFNFISKSGLNATLAGTLPGFQGIFYDPFTDTSTGVRVN
jgi:hypothetical protein